MSANDATLVLAADFGSSAVKAIATTLDGSVVASATSKYPTDRSQPLSATQDPSDWWEALLTVLARLEDDHGISPARFGGIGFSSHYPSLLVLEGWHPIEPAWTWMDERGIDHCSRVRNALAGIDSAPNHNDVEAFHPLPKLLALEEYTDLSNGSYRVAQGSTYLAARLIDGTVGLDATCAAWYHNFDLESGTWDHRVTDALGLPRSLFPPIVDARDVVGSVSAAASEQTGLTAGTAVIAGTGDAVAAALGAGVQSPGECYITTGTGGCVSVVTSSPAYVGGLVTENHVVDRRWLVEGIIKNIGNLTHWFRSVIDDGAEMPDAEYWRTFETRLRASGAGAGGLICLPYWDGTQSPLNQPSARGAIVGFDHGTTRDDIARSVVEGIGYSIRHNLDLIVNEGHDVDSVVITGGPSSSDTLCQLLADILGRTVERADNDETAPIGVARLVIEALTGSPPPRESNRTASFTPGDEESEVYRTGYRTYLSLAEGAVWKAGGRA